MIVRVSLWFRCIRIGTGKKVLGGNASRIATLVKRCMVASALRRIAIRRHRTVADVELGRLQIGRHLLHETTDPLGQSKG
jgi:hypothetical protein